ncbi:hypothetical protein [Micromonospora musae]|uniref:hypothetical protein n=1 Tax=Micromonospora musae TaxID=1894970 RepID=UPI0018F6983B|nr:hypothetical protein [Micromonospora musae]
MLGTSSGSHTLHYLLEDAFLAGDELSDTFLAQVQGHLSYASACCSAGKEIASAPLEPRSGCPDGCLSRRRRR